MEVLSGGKKVYVEKVYVLSLPHSISLHAGVQTHYSIHRCSKRADKLSTNAFNKPSKRQWFSVARFDTCVSDFKLRYMLMGFLQTVFCIEIHAKDRRYGRIGRSEPNRPEKAPERVFGLSTEKGLKASLTPVDR